MFRRLFQFLSKSRASTARRSRKPQGSRWHVYTNMNPTHCFAGCPNRPHFEVTDSTTGQTTRPYTFHSFEAAWLLCDVLNEGKP